MGHAERFRYPTLKTETEVACPAGHPRVLRCHPLFPEGERRVPFPTRFWLACDDLVRAVSALEHDGLVPLLQAAIENDEDLRERVRRDHQSYIAERWDALDEEEKAYAEATGLATSLLECGIGGIRNFRAVKCLHLHYAHHLARGSAIGALIDEQLDPHACRGLRSEA